MSIPDDEIDDDDDEVEICQTCGRKTKGAPVAEWTYRSASLALGQMIREGRTSREHLLLLSHAMKTQMSFCAFSQRMKQQMSPVQ